MKLNQLGNGLPAVGELGLGTMTFGAETDEPEAWRQLDRYVQVGGNFVDTADVYAGGESERIIGRWLADRSPEGIVLATKGRFAPPAGHSGASRGGLEIALEQSLQRLGVDSVDLYYVHGWDPEAAIEETLGFLTEAVTAGKIGAVGWSNTTAWQLQHILDTARHGGFVEPIVFQPQYNLLDRNIEIELMPLCLEAGVAIAPWSPLGGGWLTGKYQKDVLPTGATRLGEDPSRGVEAYATRNTDRVWSIIDTADTIAGELGVWIGAIALRWLLSRPGVKSILLGARTAEQLEQSLAVVDCRLTEDAIARLTAASAPGLPPYPYGMLERFSGMKVWQDLGTHRPEPNA
jgi:aryl-alcohol dehydrogenase-like predicted oxidoreductase